jgi:hypothetical protein
MDTTEQPTHAVNGASRDPRERLDVAVVGAGQAGLGTFSPAPGDGSRSSRRAIP